MTAPSPHRWAGPDRPRIIVGTWGLDQHEIGAMFVSTVLRDAGADVVYIGRFLLPEGLLATAIQEDADAVAISCHSWEYLGYTRELLARIASNETPLRVVLGGSVITAADAAELRSEGVAAVVGSGATAGDIVAAFVND